MDNLTLIMIGLTVLCIISVVVVLNLMQNNKNKKIKKTLEQLEVEKNKLASSPIVPELAKVESFLNNEKLEVLYDEWSNRLKQIKETQIPRLSDMILEAEYSLSQMDYKSTMYKIAKLEMEVYKVRTNSEFLLGEIKEITSSEERSRTIITKYKARYRELFQKFDSHRVEFADYEKIVENQFEVIAKRFKDFEIIMDNNEYTEVGELINIIDELLNHIKVVIEEVPSIYLMTTSVLPKRIKEVSDVYNQMVKAGYPLDYLNVEYNISEANSKIQDVINRTRSLNLKDNLLDLKVLLDYFDSLFSDFEQEKIARASYEDNNHTFKNKLNKINQIVNDIFEQIDDIKSIYDLSDDDINNLKEVKEELNTLNTNYKVLIDHTGNNTFAFSKLLREIETLALTLSKIEEKLDNSLESIGSMRDDEVRARQQLEEIKLILKDSKFKMRDYNLPFIPNSYYVELREASSAIREIVKELDKKPIAISVLNTRVDTARDLVLKLYTKTKEMLKTAMFAEMAIVYGNRYRSSYEELNKPLIMSEQLFYKGEYQKSLELSINVLNKIEPGIYDKLLNLYGNEKNTNV